MAADYRPSALLKKIAEFTAWSETQDFPLPYKVFKKIMMGKEEMEPVMTYERTVKEKYNLLVDLGIVSKTGVLKAEFYSVYVGGKY